MIKYTFLRKDNGHANGCIAYELDLTNNTVTYGVSSLSPKDRFNRSLARDLAKNNMKYVLTITFKSAGLLYKDILENIIAIDKMDSIVIKNHLSTLSTLPTPKRNFNSRVIRSAKRWLRLNNR